MFLAVYNIINQDLDFNNKKKKSLNLIGSDEKVEPLNEEVEKIVKKGEIPTELQVFYEIISGKNSVFL